MKKLAAALSNGHIRIWSNGGELINDIDAHNKAVTCIAWSPDSLKLASSSNDKTVKLWFGDGNLLTVIERKVRIPRLTVKLHGSVVTFLDDEGLFMPKKGVVIRGKLAEDAKLFIRGTVYTFGKGSELFIHRNGILEKGTLREISQINIGGKIYTIKKDGTVTFHDNGNYSYLPIIEKPVIDGIRFETLKGFRGIGFHKSGKVFSGWTAGPVTVNGMSFEKISCAFMSPVRFYPVIPKVILLLMVFIFQGKRELSFTKTGILPRGHF